MIKLKNVKIYIGLRNKPNPCSQNSKKERGKKKKKSTNMSG